MKLLNGDTNINFMGLRRYSVILSITLMLIALVALFARGLNFGIDFTGGTLIEVGYEQAADLEEVRSVLQQGGYPEAVAQHFGTTRDVLVRIAPREGVKTAQLTEEVLGLLEPVAEGMSMRRIEFVGPQVGEELTEQGGLALLIALGAILAYVGFRFEFRFALGSVAALVHDVVITLGAFAIFQFEFDLTVLAALLAVIGYSLNDTIVVFDRIRENFIEQIKGPTEQVMNTSINQTLTRTVMTSVTTLIVLIALLVLGGEVISGFATALIVGVIIGTYSSIFVASVAALMLGVSKERFKPIEKDEDNFGAMV